MKALSGRFGSLVTMLLAIVLVVSLSGAQARTADRSSTGSASAGQRAATAAAARADNKFGIPFPVPPPPEGYSDYQQPYGGPVDKVPAYVGKSKVQLVVPAVNALAYVRSCSAVPLFEAPEVQTCCPTFAADPSCPKSAIVTHATSTVDDSGPSWFRIDAPLWVSSPGSSRPYGIFPRADVQLLAFGSVPATASVYLEQPIGAKGYVEPLNYTELTFKSSVNSDGTVRVADFPLPQPYAAADTFTLVEKMTLSGPVDVRIDNLRVDGVPVDVGPDCRTSKPATLRYSGPRGWRSDSAPTASLRGRPGEFQPLEANLGTGTATAHLDIPAFRGCRDGGGSLDPLVTALAAGPDNTADVHLTKAIRSCRVPGDDPSRTFPCSTYPGDPNAQTQQVAAGRQSFALPAARRSLDRIAKSLRSMPRAHRASVIDALPVQVRAYVRSKSG